MISLDERCEEDGPDYLTSAMEVFPLLYASADRRSSVPVLGTGRIEDYVETTVPTYSDPMFRAHFRMTRSSFEVKQIYWYMYILL